MVQKLSVICNKHTLSSVPNGPIHFEENAMNIENPFTVYNSPFK